MAEDIDEAIWASLTNPVIRNDVVPEPVLIRRRSPACRPNCCW